MTKYLIDANVFITAGNLHYDFDVCPAFWDWLAEQHKAGKVFSIERVKKELVAKQDRVSHWTRTMPGGFFLEPPEKWESALARVGNWVHSQNYRKFAVREFMDMDEKKPADYYLIAHALHGGFVVVTHELRSDSKKKVKIPNVCDGVSVKFVSPSQMLKDEKARFVLEGK